MGCILEKTAYEWELAVNDFDVDRFNRLRLSALLKLHQEIGERHLNECGTRSDDMRNNQGLAFVFTKIKVIIHKLPKQKDKITITTWCSELKGIRFYRNYILRDENGNLLTETKAEVTVIDLKERKLVRPSEIKGFDDFLYNFELVNGCDKPQKLSIPENQEKTVTREIRFSDIDYNGHVNNTVYADIALDCLDLELLKKDIKGFEINYVSEVMPEETLKLTVSSQENAKIIVGNASDRHCFTAKISFCNLYYFKK